MAKDDRIWKCLNAVTRTKDASLLDDPEFAKFYTPYTINMALGHHADTVLAANLMNERHGLTPELQFMFLLHTIRPRFRKSEWLKTTVSDDAEALAEYYGCSVRHARTLVSLHTSDQMTYIRQRLEKGGASTKTGARHDTS
jgi:hypothetical protein